MIGGEGKIEREGTIGCEGTIWCEVMIGSEGMIGCEGTAREKETQINLAFEAAKKAIKGTFWAKNKIILVYLPIEMKNDP